MVHMQIPKDHVEVKIKTESAIIMGIVHTMVNGRLSDYMSSHVGKFIPVTNAKVFHADKITRKDIEENGVERKVVFVNVEKIEMIEYL